MPESAKTKEFVRYLAYLKDNGYGKYKCEKLYRYYIEFMLNDKENKLCKLKGHMWYASKRKDVQKEDGVYSIAIEQQCARCSSIEEIEQNPE